MVVLRERHGESLAAVFASEADATGFIKTRIRRGSIIHADEAASWDRLHAMFKVKRINHSQAYSRDGICTNKAEGYFSRLRRAEAGHGHISGIYLLRYAQEAAFREDMRRVPNGEQVSKVAGLAMSNRVSVDFTGYWQRHTSE